MALADFVRELAPYAKAASGATGLAPEVILAQWGLETGWGSSKLFREGKNLAGIKATTSWIGPTVGEYRAYPSLAAAVRDYVAVMQKPYYEQVRKAHDPYSQAAALGQSPWAEDPEYGTKLVQMVPTVQEALRSVSAGENWRQKVFPAPDKTLTEEEFERQGGSVWGSLSEEERRVIEEDLYSPGTGTGLDWMRPVRYILRWVIILAVGLAAMYSLAQAFAPEVEAVVGAAGEAARMGAKVITKGRSK